MPRTFFLVLLALALSLSTSHSLYAQTPDSGQIHIFPPIAVPAPEAVTPVEGNANIPIVEVSCPPGTFLIISTRDIHTTFDAHTDSTSHIVHKRCCDTPDCRPVVADPCATSNPPPYCTTITNPPPPPPPPNDPDDSSIVQTDYNIRIDLETGQTVVDVEYSDGTVHTTPVPPDHLDSFTSTLSNEYDHPDVDGDELSSDNPEDIRGISSSIDYENAGNFAPNDPRFTTTQERRVVVIYIPHPTPPSPPGGSGGGGGGSGGGGNGNPNQNDDDDCGSCNQPNPSPPQQTAIIDDTEQTLPWDR